MTLGIVMKRIALCLMGLLAAAVLAQSPAADTRAKAPQFKGVELYSWQDNSGAWRYSLLPGTNRLKTKDEIFSKSTMIKDSSELKQRLALLATGEEVMWFNSEAPGLSYPDAKVVADIQEYAKAIRVNLVVAQ